MGQTRPIVWYNNKSCRGRRPGGGEEVFCRQVGRQFRCRRPAAGFINTSTQRRREKESARARERAIDARGGEAASKKIKGESESVDILCPCRAVRDRVVEGGDIERESNKSEHTDKHYNLVL